MSDDITNPQPGEQKELPAPASNKSTNEPAIDSISHLDDHLDNEIDSNVTPAAADAASGMPEPAPVSSGRPMQEQPAYRSIEATPEERLQPEVPGEIPTGVDGEDAEHAMHRMSRRSFLWAGAILAGSYAGWKVFTGNPQQDGILSPLRHNLEFNERLSRSYFSPARLAPNFPVSMAQTPKVNGTYGVDDEPDKENWRLKVEGAHGKDAPFELTLKDIKKLPRVEMVTEHKCIEGWSVIVHWAGAQFADFAAKYMPPARNGGVPDINRPGDLVRYVGMSTPDGGYYIGLDMESALHPQTLLCYEMNGQPLPDEHGAPLRLVIPIKYGIKSIKRIGTITYSDTQPADYWAEQGYDWYSGH